MRDYSRVSPRFWTGKTGRALRKMGRDELLVALYLITCPSSNLIGLYYLPIPTLSHETGIPFEGALKALRRVSEAGFAFYDEEDEVIWVPQMARIQVAEELNPKDNRVKAVIREAEKQSKCRFFNDFMDRYEEPFRLQTLTPLRSPFEAPSKPPPTPLRSQDQDQDQKQDQKQEQKQEHRAQGSFFKDRPKKPKKKPPLPDEALELAKKWATLHPAWADEEVSDSDIKAWAGEFEKMNRLDNRPWDHTGQLVDFICRDTEVRGTWHGWASVCQSPQKLRKKNKDGIKFHKAISQKMKPVAPAPQQRQYDIEKGDPENEPVVPPTSLEDWPEGMRETARLHRAKMKAAAAARKAKWKTPYLPGEHHGDGSNE